MEKNLSDDAPVSQAHYFTWINNTCEGSTERQTLINLAYFDFMQRSFGMKLDLYAFDAGNLDSCQGSYMKPDDTKIKLQFPHGYATIANAAAKNSIRLGIWAGGDGFGDTLEEAVAREEIFVSLCRDNNFALFKFDSYGGALRPEKLTFWGDMIRCCREYVPDLTVLNFHIELGEFASYADTFTWQNIESYIDVNSIGTTRTGMHNRVSALSRGLTPDLIRKADDHGVCLSSCLDFFEDELISHAFGRSLILSPSIYGNPWLLRDSEQATLAHIFGLHKQYAELLRHGDPVEGGEELFAVSRGNGKLRFVCAVNGSWEPKTFTVSPSSLHLDETNVTIRAVSHHPFTCELANLSYTEKITLTVEPFRAALWEFSCDSDGSRVIPGMIYEVIRDIKDEPLIIRVCNDTDYRPVLLGRSGEPYISDNNTAELLYETAMFAISNDSLERQAANRAGETAYPEVKAARNAFFNQKTYIARGCDSSAAFDGDPATFFDGASKTAYGGYRMDGGCMRFDAGAIINVDSLEIDYFEAYEPIFECRAQKITEVGCYGEFPTCKYIMPLASIEIIEENISIPVAREAFGDPFEINGRKMRALYTVNGPARYFTIPSPVDRIFRVAPLNNGAALPNSGFRLNVLMPPPGSRMIVSVRDIVIDMPMESRPSFLAAALDGTHGIEGAYCVAECDGKLYGFTHRAMSYPCIAWNYKVMQSPCNYTYYLPVSTEMYGKKLTVHILGLDKENCDWSATAWLCREKLPSDGEIIEIL